MVEEENESSSSGEEDESNFEAMLIKEKCTICIKEVTWLEDHIQAFHSDSVSDEAVKESPVKEKPERMSETELLNGLDKTSNNVGKNGHSRGVKKYKADGTLDKRFFPNKRGKAKKENWWGTEKAVDKCPVCKKQFLRMWMEDHIQAFHPDPIKETKSTVTCQIVDQFSTSPTEEVEMENIEEKDGDVKESGTKMKHETPSYSELLERFDSLAQITVTSGKNAHSRNVKKSESDWIQAKVKSEPRGAAMNITSEKVLQYLENCQEDCSGSDQNEPDNEGLDESQDEAKFGVEKYELERESRLSLMDACPICNKQVRKTWMEDHKQVFHPDLSKRAAPAIIISQLITSLPEEKRQKMFKDISSRYMCEHCDYKFKSEDLLEEHQISKHGSDQPVKCQACGVHFTSYHSRKRHERLKHQANPIECDLCSVRLRSKYMLARHIAKMHSPGTKAEDTASFQNGQPSVSKQDLVSEELMLQKEKQLFEEFANKNALKVKDVCDLCGQKINKTKMKLHLAAKHGIYDQAFKCKDCDTTFYSSATLNHHWRQAHGTKIPCDKCGEMVNEHKMKQHIVSNHTKSSEMPHLCRLCDPPKGFKRPTRYRDHVLKCHSIGAATPFGCKKCDQVFSSLKERRLHRKQAHGDMTSTAICPHCGKAFVHDSANNAQGAMESHVLEAHEKRKTHFCDKCDPPRGFYGEYRYKAHMKASHSAIEKLQLRCDSCDKIMPSVRSSAMAHLMWHIGYRPFSCGYPACTYNCWKLGQIKNHFKNVHKDQVFQKAHELVDKKLYQEMRKLASERFHKILDAAKNEEI